MSRAGGMQADLPGSSTNMESVSPYTTRAFHLSLASTMRMAFSRVSRADCSTVDNTGDGINDASHTHLHHQFVANTHAVFTATAYWLFTVFDLVSTTETEELSNMYKCRMSCLQCMDKLLQLCRAGAEKQAVLWQHHDCLAIILPDTSLHNTA